MPEIENYDILIIGSGEAGKYLAWTMAKAGRRTAVVERKLIGGSCPNIACLPSKNVIYSAKVTSLARCGEAEKIGMKMKPTKLVIFGNPKAGTPLMLAAPSSAIDLPLKVLVWEDAKGKVWISYNSPAYLQERHRIPGELLQNIAVVEALAAKAAE
jgi:ribulose 1,5-bisphosphate synthetase/thiazole synthase